MWLARALEESRARGFLGPGEIAPHIRHAEGFIEAYEGLGLGRPARYMDLGSGGGLPGFVLLDRWRESGVLLDSMVRRTKFLEEALAWDDAPPGALVVTARAEDAARVTGLSESFQLVVARSFGPPAVVAECACRFLEADGVLLVSEPPGDEGLERWPAKDLGPLGLSVGPKVNSEFTYQVLFKTLPVDARFPRKSGVPSKKPLF